MTPDDSGKVDSALHAPRHSRDSLVGISAAVLSAIAFATSGILAKVGFSEGLAINQMLLIRFGVAACVLSVAAALATGAQRALGFGSITVLFCMGAVGVAAQAYTFYAALESLPASLVVLLLYVYPALIALANWLVFRKVFDWRHGAAMVTTFVGIGLLVGVEFEVGLGILYALGSAAIYTGYILVVERIVVRASALSASAIIMAGATATWLIITAVTGSSVTPTTYPGWAVVLLLGIVPTAFGIAIFLVALRRLGSSPAALFSCLEPVVAVLLAVVLLGDEFRPLQAAGAFVVVVSVVALQWPGGQTFRYR